ncbi:MAG: DUF4265 domain-containing protein [Solirubrobacterales bacterium]
MSATDHLDAESIRVKAPVDDPDIPIWTEVMSADPDPADPDQAVLLNVPFLVDGINFGDIVRLGPAEECGVRPIVEIVLASGHVRISAATEPGEAADLVAELERTFPAYALRIEGHSDQLLSISIHPDLDPEEVFDTVAAWLAADAVEGEGLAISPIIETELGRVRWPRFELS